MAPVVRYGAMQPHHIIPPASGNKPTVRLLYLHVAAQAPGVIISPVYTRPEFAKVAELDPPQNISSIKSYPQKQTLKNTIPVKF